MSRRLKRLVVALAIVLAGATGSACGVSTQSSPTTINRRDVPFDLLKKPKPSSSGTTTTTTATKTPARAGPSTGTSSP